MTLNSPSPGHDGKLTRLGKSLTSYGAWYDAPLQLAYPPGRLRTTSRILATPLLLDPPTIKSSWPFFIKVPVSSYVPWI
jgi:hypothetical protein